ncbi:Putative uncharacterized protein [Moritella viscosa]|nr:Putative uncharacterized protein [Moritella viscosa]
MTYYFLSEFILYALSRLFMLQMPQNRDENGQYTAVFM